MRSKETNTRASRLLVILYTAAAVISLAGLADAIYLTVAHLTGENLACGESSGCSAVLGSAYASIGPVPLAGLGIVGYFTAFSCATLAAFRYTRAQKFFTVIVAVMFVVTLWLLFLQAFVLHAFCRYCLFSAALVFLLAALAVVMPRSR